MNKDLEQEKLESHQDEVLAMSETEYANYVAEHGEEKFYADLESAHYGTETEQIVRDGHIDRKKIILAGIIWGILFSFPLLIFALIVPLFGIPLFLIFIPAWISAIIIKLNGVKSFNPFTWKITKE